MIGLRRVTMIRLAAALALLLAFVSGPGHAAGEAGDAPVHHSIQARLDPVSGRLSLVDALTVRGRTVLEFRIAPWLELESVLLEGRPVPITADGQTRRLRLPDSGLHRLSMRLRGAVPPLPHAPRRRDVPPAVSGAQGSFLSGYAGWFPLTADDWTAYRLEVEVPAPYRAVATGALKEESLGEKANRALFVADYPAEPPALFAGQYTVRERIDGDIRIRTYFEADLDRFSDQYLQAASEYLQRFQAQIGPYPFRDFHMISSPLPVGLGFPNLTYIGRMVVPLPFMRGRSLAHEVLHNWWGNGVAADYATGNWAEGLTTYMADYALALDAGAEPAREMRLGWLRNYAALPPERDTPVTGFTFKRHDAGQVVGYDKVAFVFHMLRDELGETAFGDGLRLFFDRHRFRIAGWAELQQAFEKVAGRDLDWFFDQWLRRTGAPLLYLDAARVRAAGDAGDAGDAYRVTLALRQDAPAYRLTVPVVIETETGEEQRRIVLDETAEAVTLSVAGRPLAVRVDPEHDLFRRLLPGESPPILRDVTLAADALTVVATGDPGAGRTARQLAERLLDVPVRLAPADSARLGTEPLLVIGTTPQVDAFLARAGLDRVPESLRGRGSARVWTARRAGARAMLVIAADDAEALAALLRPLPHYGGKSYLVFEGRRAVETGVWTVDESPLGRHFVR